MAYAKRGKIMKIDKSFCAVSIDKDKCKGCINCMKRCPTEAIRIRNGKAVIDYERCVSCGECIRICKNNAKTATCDTMEVTKGFKYKVALAAPSLLGQFPNVKNPAIVYNALKNVGFDDYFEVARKNVIFAENYDVAPHFSARTVSLSMVFMLVTIMFWAWAVKTVF